MAFSLAYEQIDAGIGALILFGVVQLTMIIYGLCKGETLSRIKLTGLLFAFGGLVYLLVPSSVSTIHLPLLNVIFMALSGFAWAVYSLAGNSKGSTPVNTAYNFLLAVPAGAAILLIVSLLMPGIITPIRTVLFWPCYPVRWHPPGRIISGIPFYRISNPSLPARFS